MYYRRDRTAGATYFITLVCHRRRRLFDSESSVEAFRQACRLTCAERPFMVQAAVILPDHVHLVLTLPDQDDDYPVRIRLIKTRCARALVAAEPRLGIVSGSRARRGELGVWQRRHWEHRIRDEWDMARHVDYIHYNPVKHGLVERASEWPWSSFHRFVKEGLLPPEWGETCHGLARLEVEGE